MTDNEINLETVVQTEHNFTNQLSDSSSLKKLIDDIGNARFVLLGESSHGTHEFYYWRAHITKQLISEKNFNIVCIEGDWPDAYLVNRFVKGNKFSGRSAQDVLQNFNRWPTWIWSNWETVALLEWLRKFNSNIPINKRIGFYGIDLFSFWESLEFLSEYLKNRDPLSYQSVIKAISCFEPFKNKEGIDLAHYYKKNEPQCADTLDYLLGNIRKNMFNYNGDEEADFNAEQNAIVVRNAERYFRFMIQNGEGAWNIRDRHMFETISRLSSYHGPESKFIIWAHNSHIGNAKGFDFGKKGFINLGQLMDENFIEDKVYKIGFSFYQGDILAASNWSGELKRWKVAKAKLNSWEQLLHKSFPEDSYFFTRNWPFNEKNTLQRSIGVVFDPQTEVQNYNLIDVKNSYDALLFIERSSSLHSLKNDASKYQIPESFPFGL